MENTDLLRAQADHAPFWQHAHQYFDRVYQQMNLDPMWRDMLASPKRVLTVSCPVKMDNGLIQVFTGYRAQHNKCAVRLREGFDSTCRCGATR